MRRAGDAEVRNDERDDLLGQDRDRHRSGIVYPDFWEDAEVNGALDSIVAWIAALEVTGGRPLIAIDGIGASGKSSFAAQIATLIQSRPVVVLHADDYFNPSAIRHARGRQSPEGFGSTPTTTTH